MSDAWGALLKEVETRVKYSMPLAFLKATDAQMQSTKALELIEQKLMKAIREPGSRLIISMPPQEGKTTLMQAACAVTLFNKPMTRILELSYSQDLAERNSVEIKRMCETMGMRFEQDQAAKGDWRILGAKGGVFAAGVGGGITGRAGDVIVVDDVIKSQQEAESEANRRHIKDWWQTSIVSRFSPATSVVIIMTRWHDDDLAGWLQTEHPEEWEVLNIPAQCVDASADPLGRKVGEYMESARGRKKSDWDRRKMEMGSRAWQALCQGSPVPEEGGIIQPEWIGKASSAELSKDGLWFSSWDLSFSGTQASDFTVGQIWKVQNQKIYLVEQVRGQWTFPQALEVFRATMKKYPQLKRNLVEAKANGQALIDVLRRERVPGLVAITPTDSKTARVHAVSPLIESGAVVFCEGRWQGDILTELAAFPYGKYDDCVDTLSQALLYLLNGSKKKRRRRR